LLVWGSSHLEIKIHLWQIVFWVGSSHLIVPVDQVECELVNVVVLVGVGQLFVEAGLAVRGERLPERVERGIFKEFSFLHKIRGFNILGNY